MSNLQAIMGGGRFTVERIPCAIRDVGFTSRAQVERAVGRHNILPPSAVRRLTAHMQPDPVPEPEKPAPTRELRSQLEGPLGKRVPMPEDLPEKLRNLKPRSVALATGLSPSTIDRITHGRKKNKKRKHWTICEETLRILTDYISKQKL